MVNIAPTSVVESFYFSLFKGLWSLVFARLYTPQNPPLQDLSNQVAIVTGANSGIGLSIAVALAKQGATVCLACRSAERGNAAVTEVIARAGEKSKDQVFCWKLDIGDLESVRTFCERWRNEGTKIDVLVHNAGIAAPPSGGVTKRREVLGMVYVTNFLGSFLMTHLLEGNLSKTARVVCTSSTGHYSAATSLLQPQSTTPSKTGILARLGLTSFAPAYGYSKAQQVLFMYLLQRHFSRSQDNQRTAHSFTPGFTSTPIFGKYDISWTSWLSDPLFAVLKATEKWVAVSTDEGAKTGIWLASCGGNGEIQGGNFWEWMTLRTSLVDLLREKKGAAEFENAVRKEWRVWERDADVTWEVGI